MRKCCHKSAQNNRAATAAAATTAGTSSDGIDLAVRGRRLGTEEGRRRKAALSVVLA